MKLIILRIVINLILVSMFALAVYSWNRLTKELGRRSEKVLTICHLQPIHL